VRDMRGGKQKIARADRGDPILDPIVTCTAGDDIQLVALVRHLRPVSRPGGETSLEIAIDEDFGRSARGYWQGPVPRRATPPVACDP